jgi:GTP-binding protein
MLQQSGQLDQRFEMPERVMDSNDLEREKGITILAKNTAVRLGDVKINIIDTPGHADFGGEVERGLTMVDGVLLLVDASEGPLPQTRFVLRKALERGLPIILVINKIDRPDSRVHEVIDEVYELFLDLDANEEQIEFPIVYCNAKNGQASLDPEIVGEDLTPLSELLLSHIPPPKYQIGHPLQALVTNLDASPYLGRLALCRVVNGVIRKGQQVAWCRVDGSVERATIGQLYVTEALDRHETDEASAGEIVAIAGINEVTIGETLADLDDPQSLPGITVDEPSLSMLIGINTSPFSGREGSQLTARMLKNRLDSELVGNVALRVIESDRPDAWIVQGRGELQLAILIENLRREGFELTVGRPQVVTKMVDDNLLEPVEFVTIDIPEEHLGTVTQLLALRKGKMVNTINHGSGRIRVEYVLPSRGLIGFHTQFLTETRGTGIAHHVFQGYEPWYGELNSHSNGSLVSDRSGDTTTFALLNLQERGTLFIGPGVAVYEGMIVGENSRASDMDVNPTKEKKLTNMRAASSDQTEKLTPPRQLSLELALELLRDDECLEITPNSLRVRKVILGQNQRRRQSN